jgi:hypothetical protein
MTAILTVDPAAMHRLADRVREAAAQAGLGTAERGPLPSAVAQLGPAALVHAVSTFLERWNPALTDLVDDAHRLADLIDLAARTYQDAESLADQGFRR